MMNESTVRTSSKKDDDNGVPRTEQCFTKTDDENQRNEKSSTKLKFMSLPNELFDLFLIYLSPCDIVQSLIGINKRLNLLIYRFLQTIDVSTKKKQWLNKYLFLIQPLVTKIKFDHSQLQTLFSTPTTIDDQYPCLKSIIWNYQFGRNDRLCESYLNVFKTKLLSLSLNLNTDVDDENITVHKNIALLLLQNDSLIEKLTFKDHSNYSFLWFSFKPNTLKFNQHLKQLTIKLHYVHDLFLLIEHLSKLEYLNVEVCEVDKNNRYDYTRIQNQTVTLSPVLKELIIDSLDLTYPRLLLLLEQFQQSIELLTLTMSIYDNLDGEILESTIVTKMPNLKQFKFLFRIVDNENVTIDAGLDKLMPTFRSTYWLTRPVMCYHERGIPCFTVLSLPWILKESDSVTNEIMNYRTNTTMPLKMNNVKSIFLASTKITLKFLKFIKETFVNLNKMIISWHTCTVDDEVINGKNKIKLNTIKTLKYYGATYDLEYIDFLLLTPNIRRLVVDGSTIHVINGYVHENEEVASMCEQISDLNIFRNYSDCDEDETEETFPNARVSSKDI